MNRVQMKERAKAVLGNNLFCNDWLLCVVVVLIFSVITTAAGTIISGVGTLLVIGPMMYGLNLVFLKKVRTGEAVDFANLFKGFTQDFGQNFVLGLLMNIFIALWSLLFIIPGIVKAYAYSMAFYIKADHPDWDWRACMKESIRITDGHKMDLFMLDLSFIGWYLVGSFVLGVGTLWVSAYHESTKTLYYEELKSAQ